MRTLQMTTQNVETVASKTDFAIVAVAIIATAAGVLGFTFLTEQPMLVRIGALVGGLAAGIAIAWFSEPGRRFIAYARESYQETKRVAWPARKETVSTTGIVFGFVALMAIFLFIVDKTLEWSLYDLLLSWR